MPDALHVGSGKVRELYALDDDRLLLVASDRISTFDVILPTEIPDKGRVLTGLSGFWFARTRDLAPNHLLALRDDGRSSECKKLEMLPIECVVRGYLSGSGWKDYVATGRVCGHELPAGLVESQQLPRPIFTPATKAETGHDENIDRAAAVELVLGDEAFTPDSSRFWPADGYRAGSTPPSYDKQFVRDYCESLGWDKNYPGPDLPDDVVTGTRARYVEAFEHLTGIAFDDYLAEPSVVLR
jgi:phosphoribosylaminoimidazole-succinocarboxamide synthase